MIIWLANVVIFVRRRLCCPNGWHDWFTWGDNIDCLVCGETRD